MECFSHYSHKSLASEKKKPQDFHLRFSYPCRFFPSSHQYSLTAQELQSLLCMTRGTENGVAISSLLLDFFAPSQTGLSFSLRISPPCLQWRGWEGMMCVNIFVKFKMRKRGTILFSHFFSRDEV